MRRAVARLEAQGLIETGWIVPGNPALRPRLLTSAVGWAPEKAPGWEQFQKQARLVRR